MTRHASLTFGAALVLAAAIHAQQVRDQALASKAGTAVISGMVVTDEQTPQPIRNAFVTVVNLDGGSRTTYTNEAGRFAVTGLPAGRYTLAASKAPFLRASYGSKRIDVPGTTITLRDGHQMTDVALRLSRGAVISGRITDENGEPAFGVPVRVMQLRLQNGERSFLPPQAGTSSDVTDDRGMFRVFGLPPGEYAVSATPRIMSGEVRAMTEQEIRATMQALQQQQAARATAQTAIGGQPYVTVPTPTPSPTPASDVEKVTVAYAPVYYPGTTQASTASTVTVGAGEERSGADFALRLVRTAKVEGMVVVPEGIAPQSVQLMMMPASIGVAGLTNLAGLEAMAMQRVIPGPDGKFTYNAVAPGQYTIAARATKSAGGAPPPPPPPPPPPGAPVAIGYSVRAVTTGSGDFTEVMPMMQPPGDPNAMQFWGQTEISVDGAPVSGVTVALQPGMTIIGKVEFRSVLTRPGADFRSVMLNLTPVSTGTGPRLSLGMPTSQVDAAGQFTIAGVTPGRYRINGNVPATQGPGAGPPWRLASAVVKGRDILDFPLDVVPGDTITDAVLTFTDGTQEILGSLQDASGRPAPDYTIVVFASDNKYWTPQSRRIRTARPATDGKFTVTSLPPGEYRMAAVADLAPGDANDPAFLEQLVPASFKITLAAGEKKTQDLKIAGGL